MFPQCTPSITLTDVCLCVSHTNWLDFQIDFPPFDLELLRLSGFCVVTLTTVSCSIPRTAQPFPWTEAIERKARSLFALCESSRNFGFRNIGVVISVVCVAKKVPSRPSRLATAGQQWSVISGHVNFVGRRLGEDVYANWKSGTAGASCGIWSGRRLFCFRYGSVRKSRRILCRSSGLERLHLEKLGPPPYWHNFLCLVWWLDHFPSR